jgi:hypothetical protein
MTNCLKWKKKTKIITLDCSFQDQLKLCFKVLLLWRYEVKDFQKCPVFYLFCVVVHENNTKYHDFNTFRKLREGATIIISWEI